MSVPGSRPTTLAESCWLSLVLIWTGADLIDNVVVGQDVAPLRVDDNAGAGRVDFLFELFRHVEEFPEQRIAIKRIVLTDLAVGRRC